MKIISPDTCFPKDLQTSILEADFTFETKLTQIANRLSDESQILFIGLTGPTCSGKTTAAKMLTKRFLQKGRTVHVISLDDFYYEKKHLLALSKENGVIGLDYDSEKMIDTELFQACISSLLAGKATVLPHFNFLTGLRERGVHFIPQKGDLFLLEGIQVLYPTIRASLQDVPYKCIAICPQSCLTFEEKTFLPNVIRLMRRLVRDAIYRGASASFTFSLWENVRKNEEKNIFPYFAECDQIVDSTMPYEIGVLRPYLEKILSEMDFEDPAYSNAQQILNSISKVKSISSEFISPNSLYREFI